jgi:hypothetical protein
MTLRVFLAGEGKTELGGRAGHAAYATSEPGVLEALLRQVSADGWSVHETYEWTRIRKLRVGRFENADGHNVLGATLKAKDAGCEVLVFSRDRDGDEKRAAAIEAAILLAPQEIAACPRIAGGVAVECIESWILALQGRHNTETLRVARANAEAIKPLGTTTYVDTIDSADAQRIPDDARSLLEWRERARRALHAEAS